MYLDQSVFRNALRNSLGLALLYSYLVPREEKKVYLFSLVLLGTVKSHGLFQLCKIVDQNLQKSLVGPCRPWGPHRGMTVGNRFIYQAVKTVCRTPVRSVFTIYQRSMKTVTAIAGVYVFLSSAKYYL